MFFFSWDLCTINHHVYDEFYLDDNQLPIENSKEFLLNYTTCLTVSNTNCFINWESRSNSLTSFTKKLIKLLQASDETTELCNLLSNVAQKGTFFLNYLFFFHFFGGGALHKGTFLNYVIRNHAVSSRPTHPVMRVMLEFAFFLDPPT